MPTTRSSLRTVIGNLAAVPAGVPNRSGSSPTCGTGAAAGVAA